MESKSKNENREKTPTPISEKLQAVECRRSERETGARERERRRWRTQAVEREPELLSECRRSETGAMERESVAGGGQKPLRESRR
jgi:hypothetical protein